MFTCCPLEHSSLKKVWWNLDPDRLSLSLRQQNKSCDNSHFWQRWQDDVWIAQVRTVTAHNRSSVAIRAHGRSFIDMDPISHITSPLYKPNLGKEKKRRTTWIANANLTATGLCLMCRLAFCYSMEMLPMVTKLHGFFLGHGPLGLHACVGWRASA